MLECHMESLSNTSKAITGRILGSSLDLQFIQVFKGKDDNYDRYRKAAVDIAAIKHCLQKWKNSS